MKEIAINRQNEGTKLLRMLKKVLPLAQINFLYKMLRKKNITLNDKKASGNEVLKSGDIIKIFFSEETYARFSGVTSKGLVSGGDTFTSIGSVSDRKLRIIYEDDDIILCNKPAGVLSQKASKDDISMVEIIADYLERKGEYDAYDSLGFKPAVANRLDRNTSGIIAVGKSVSGLKLLSGGFKSGDFEKLYLCIVKGVLNQGVLLNGLWSKDSHGNRVIIRNVEARGFNESYLRISTLRPLRQAEPAQGAQNVQSTLNLSKRTNKIDFSFPRRYFKKGNIPVQTYAEPVITNGKITLCLVKLLTGKTHQIRAQMAESGYPLLGDHKYGDRLFNEYYKDIYAIEFQLLHAYMIRIPQKGVFFADIPDYFISLLKSESLWTDI